MPTHGKSKVTQTFGPKHCPTCTKGYQGTTTHRGTQIMTPPQIQLLNVKQLPHTNWYRSKQGNLYGKRRNVK